MPILFTLRGVFARNLLRGNRRGNTFGISFWCLAWDSNPRFSSNKPTHCLACAPIIQCPVINPITAESLLLWSLSRTAVRPLFGLGQIFCAVLSVSKTAHLLLTRSTIALSITSLQVPKWISNVENSSESSMVASFLTSLSALQLPH